MVHTWPRGNLIIIIFTFLVNDLNRGMEKVSLVLWASLRYMKPARTLSSHNLADAGETLFQSTSLLDPLPHICFCESKVEDDDAFRKARVAVQKLFLQMQKHTYMKWKAQVMYARAAAIQSRLILSRMQA